MTDTAVLSLRYQLTLPEAKEGFALATFAKNRFTRFLTPLLSLGLIAWGITLGFNGVGRYYVILGATFLLLQILMRVWVLPALFARQYRNYGYGTVTQGIDLYQDHAILRVADREQNFRYSDIKRCIAGQLSYLLELKDRTVVIIPKQAVVQTGQQVWFESVLCR